MFYITGNLPCNTTNQLLDIGRWINVASGQFCILLRTERSFSPTRRRRKKAQVDRGDEIVRARGRNDASRVFSLVSRYLRAASIARR